MISYALGITSVESQQKYSTDHFCGIPTVIACLSTGLCVISYFDSDDRMLVYVVFPLITIGFWCFALTFDGPCRWQKQYYCELSGEDGSELVCNIAQQYELGEEVMILEINTASISRPAQLMWKVECYDNKFGCETIKSMLVGRSATSFIVFYRADAPIIIHHLTVKCKQHGRRPNISLRLRSIRLPSCAARVAARVLVRVLRVPAIPRAENTAR
jgi:hypothetical protein